MSFSRSSAPCLAAPERTTWIGRRDHTILATMIQTGLRASELVGLGRADVELGVGAHVSCLGKGRKQRITPLTKTTVALLAAWINERRCQPTDPLFPSRAGNQLSRDSLEQRVAKHAANAALSCPNLAAKTVSPHTLRHTAAMRLLAAGVDTTVIALWLGHESVATTQIYIHAKIAGRTDTLFSDDAITLIHNAARGYPRAVNNLAVHALTAAFAAKAAIVDEIAARIAVTETGHD